MKQRVHDNPLARYGALLLYPLSALIFLVPFVAVRIWFFTDYPLGGIRADSDSYFQVVQAMDAGRLPDFSIRSPMYPLFMKLIYSFSDTITAVISVQTVLSACIALFMLYAVHRFNRWLVPWAAIGMAAYYSGTLALEYDTALLPEAIYVDFILFSFACLILALTTKRALWFGLASLGAGAAILTKPAGFFLVGTYLLVIIFAAINRYGARRLVSFILPLPSMLLALSIYNYFVIGAFTPTAFGESQIAFATFTFWEQDERYPREINDAIAAVQERIGSKLTEKDRRVLASSFSIGSHMDFYQVFDKGFDYPALDRASAPWQGSYFAARAWIGTISMDSITKHPDMYQKFVAAQFATNYLHNITHQPDFVDNLEDRVQKIYVERRFSVESGNPFKTALAKEFADPPLLPMIQFVGSGGDTRVRLTSHSTGRQLYEAVWTVRKALFSTPIWSVANLGILCLALVKLFTSRGRHVGAFVLFAITVSVLGAAMVVSLVEEFLVRYSYTIEWAYYLSVALLPCLFLGGAVKKAGAVDRQGETPDLAWQNS